MDKTLEQVKAEYVLSQEEHNEISKKIKTIMFFRKSPSSKPKAIINIAPAGSGKTGLNGYSLKEFPDNNVIIINSDELKKFHPKIEEIAKLYPEYYTKVTNPDSNGWVDDLLYTALSKGYNVIYEGTGRNLKLLLQVIKEKMKNYDITLRGMAVSDFNCLMSIIERYEGQVISQGWGRLVTLEHFYKTYNEMPYTIESLESLGILDKVEVYIRGEKPQSPIKVYDSKLKTQNIYTNAKEAVLSERKKDIKNAKKNYINFNKNLRKLLENRKTTKEEEEILGKMQEINDESRDDLSQGINIEER